MKHRKHSTGDFFDDNDSQFFATANSILALATLISILSIVLETVGSLASYQYIFKFVEYSTTLLFTLEYLARVHYAPSKGKYIFSFFGIADLFAIIPTYLGIGNLTFLKSVRALRILRFLRMTRMAKLAKISKNDIDHSSVNKINVEIYALALFTSIVALGTMLYIFDGANAYAKDIPTGMYWAFKVILGGISFEQPVTTAGLIILVLARFISLILLGFMLNMMATFMKKVLIGSESEDK